VRRLALMVVVLAVWGALIVLMAVVLLIWVTGAP
jgi:hypothetical protein